ncbi:T-box transcription factor TBX21 isoform X2 [Paroedura picta]|uniref:T-box transcription factor TBX21 isoform X2 n=1 Tax=Paroedura picta TaxID=143630 RepID=UPI004056D6F1
MGALDSLAGGAADATTAAALTMLNGAESQNFAKEPPDLPGTASAKDGGELKLGAHAERFYYAEPHLQEAGCPLGLAYGAQVVAGGFGATTPAAPGRFLGPAAAASYSPQPPPPGPAPASAHPSSYALSPGELYASPGDLYPGAHGGGGGGGEGCYPPPVPHMFPRGPLYPMPGYQVAGKLQVVLNNYPLWAKFHKHQTEMIITKQGRRMFPFLSFNISGLDPVAHYSICVDIVLVDQHHWRYQGGKWVQCGKAEGNMPGNRTYMHPDSPNTGAHWMRQEISFGKLKLTNNKGASNNVTQMIVLQSLHKYQPRLHVTEAKEGEVDEGHASLCTFTFPETQFIAVTAYQNADITQLKIDHNPFAKGFRDNFDSMYNTTEGDRTTPSPPSAGSCQQLLAGSHFQPFLHDQYSLPRSRFYNRERGPLPLQPKDTHHWYFASQQPPTAPLEYSAYDGDYRGNKFMPYGMKPFALQASPHTSLPYYQEHPFGPPTAWSSPTQYHPKPTPGALSWFRPMRDLQPVPPGDEKGKDSEGWTEPGSVKSADSSDSGLYEAECKRRRMSPYVSSAESSPPIRNGDLYDKEGGDAGYYGFYGN